MEQAAQFAQVDSFPPPSPHNFNSLVSLSLTNRTNNLTHGLHRFPAKYIPQVPRWALDAYAFTGSRVLDPFAGSGTTNVEAASKGLDSVALEINPLSRLIIRAKTTALPVDQLSATAAAIDTAWSPHKGALITPIEGVSNFEHWFTEPAWRELLGLKSAIVRETHDSKELEFFLTVFSSILRVVSNADDQSQKTYVSGTRPKSPPPVRASWANAVQRALRGMTELNATPAPASTVSVPDDGDALCMPLPDASFDLAVTSPPYLDSVDYPYNLMLEHFWLADEIGLPSRRDFNRLRQGQVGAKQPGVTGYPERVLSDLIDLGEIPEYRRPAVQNYFAVMDRHFSEMSRVLRSGSRYVFVVGNSATRVGQLPVHKALLRLAEAHGLGLEHAFGYRLRRHYMKFPRAGRGGIILVDWVLTLQKGLAGGRQIPDLVDAHVPIDPLAVAH